MLGRGLDAEQHCRHAESLCHPPSPLSRGNETTTFAPRPRALNRPVVPPTRPPADRGPAPIRRGSPPALRTAISTLFKNGCVRGLSRAPPRRDRPGLTRKFSLSSPAMTRPLTSGRARTRAAGRRSRQIASRRMMAKKKPGSSSTHIASAIARKIEIKNENSKGGTRAPFAVLKMVPR